MKVPIDGGNYFESMLPQLKVVNHLSLKDVAYVRAIRDEESGRKLLGHHRAADHILTLKHQD